jgi:hypothetical protein
MKRNLFLAILLTAMLIAGTTVSRAAAMPRITPAPNAGESSHAARTTMTKKRAKRNKLERGAVDVEQETKAAARDLGKAGKKTGKATSKVSKRAAKDTERVVKDTPNAAVKGTEKAGKATARVTRKIGHAFKPKSKTQH